jgi:Rne/Rng family ribonuclease
VGNVVVGNTVGHVFISYVREDSGEVDELQQELEAAGIPVWRDTADLWPGEDWGAKIRQAITGDALVFIACFSSHSVARQRSYQNEELLLAIEQLRRRQPGVPWLIPVRFDDCEIPGYELGAGRTLTSLQRADLFGPERHRAAGRLITAVNRLLGQHAPAVTRPQTAAELRLPVAGRESPVRREAVKRLMLVRQADHRTEIAVLEDGVLVEHYADQASRESLIGNVYLGRTESVLASLEMAFVDIGTGSNAVLFAGDVNLGAGGPEGAAKPIESALTPGRPIMVQVVKDPVGRKGARLSGEISLRGRYLVYVTDASVRGISRRLPEAERARLAQVLENIAPEGGGLIAGAAAVGASEEELRHDVTRLVTSWQAIEHKAQSVSAPELLHGEPGLAVQIIRDAVNEDFTRLVVAGDSEWDLVSEYVRDWAPNLAGRLEQWAGDSDLFAARRVDEQSARARARKVSLPGGGSLVIDTTDAMTVIDVNLGSRLTGQAGGLEQAITRTDLEAAEEIVTQLRLRDIGGIISIDFIDIVRGEAESRRELVVRRLLECLARDRTASQVAEVISLGLVQMTRKRIGYGRPALDAASGEAVDGR